jgi:hypothetical protein
MGFNGEAGFGGQDDGKQRNRKTAALHCRQTSGNATLLRRVSLEADINSSMKSRGMPDTTAMHLDLISGRFAPLTSWSLERSVVLACPDVMNRSRAR